jgi:gliding motility-associated-like protein
VPPKPDIGALSIICRYYPDGLELLGKGNWSGPQISENRFYPDNLTEGTYQLNYDFTSNLGCNYDTTLTVKVDRLQKPVILKKSGNLCEEGGSVTLSIEGTADAEAEYHWMKQSDAKDEFKLIGKTGLKLQISDKSRYKVVASKDGCEVTSEAFMSRDTLILAFTPAAKEMKACFKQNVELNVTYNAGSHYAWYFAENAIGPFELLDSDRNVFYAEQTGYYQVFVKLGACSFEGEAKHIVIAPQDSVFVPNVFTPNGDGINDEFKVLANGRDVVCTVLNRYGHQIFSSAGKEVTWSGEGVASGVYFWNVLFRTCDGQQKHAKGFVQVLR